MSAYDTAHLHAESARLRVAWTASVLALFGWTIAWLVIVEPENGVWIWATQLGLATLPGKYLIFVGLHTGAVLGPWGIALVAIAVDVVVALTLAVFLGFLLRFQWLARTLRAAHDRAEAVLVEYPGVRRLAFWGVVLFVFLPLPASGSIGGTFVAQIVGLSRTRGAIAVCLGGVIVSATFAGLATAMGPDAEHFLRNPWVSIASLALFALFLFATWKRIQKTLKRRE